MRQIIDDKHLGIYGIVTRDIKLVTVWRLLLLMDDVLTGRRFCQLEYLQVIFFLDFHRQDHMPHKMNKPCGNLAFYPARQEFLLVEYFRFLLFDKK